VALPPEHYHNIIIEAEPLFSIPRQSLGTRIFRSWY